MENPIKYIGYARRDEITFDISVKDNTKLSMFEYESKKANDLIEKVNGWIRRKEKQLFTFHMQNMLMMHIMVLIVFRHKTSQKKA